MQNNNLIVVDEKSVPPQDPSARGEAERLLDRSVAGPYAIAFSWATETSGLLLSMATGYLAMKIPATLPVQFSLFAGTMAVHLGGMLFRNTGIPASPTDYRAIDIERAVCLAEASAEKDDFNTNVKQGFVNGLVHNNSIVFALKTAQYMGRCFCEAAKTHLRHAFKRRDKSQGLMEDLLQTFDSELQKSGLAARSKEGAIRHIATICAQKESRRKSPQHSLV